MNTGYVGNRGWPRAGLLPALTAVAMLATACGGATILIGALAGLVPAIRAARLSPTQALWAL